MPPETTDLSPLDDDESLVYRDDDIADIAITRISEWFVRKDSRELPMDEDDPLLGADYGLRLEGDIVPTTTAAVGGETANWKDGQTILELPLARVHTDSLENTDELVLSGTLKEKAMVLDPTGALARIIDDIPEIPLEDETDIEAYLLHLFCKKTDSLSAFWEGFGMLRLNEIGVPTLATIYPRGNLNYTKDEAQQVMDEQGQSTEAFITIYDKNLHPLSSENLFDGYHDDVVGRLLHTVGIMHGNDFIQGDSHLANYAIGNENGENQVFVTAFDTEFCLDIVGLRDGRLTPSNNYGAAKYIKQAYARFNPKWDQVNNGEMKAWWVGLSEDDRNIQVEVVKKMAVMDELKKLAGSMYLTGKDKFDGLSEDGKQEEKAKFSQMLRVHYLGDHNDLDLSEEELDDIGERLVNGGEDDSL